MSCEKAVIYWGSSATVPITTPASLQKNGLFETPLNTYDFSTIAGAGFWNIAVPVSLGTINAVSFNDSPIQMLPDVDAVDLTSTYVDTTKASFTNPKLDQPVQVFIAKASLYTCGDSVVISDLANSLNGTVTRIYQNSILVRASATVGTTVGLGTVAGSSTLAFNVYRPPVALIAFNGLSITAA